MSAGLPSGKHVSSLIPGRGGYGTAAPGGKGEKAPPPFHMVSATSYQRQSIPIGLCAPLSPREDLLLTSVRRPPVSSCSLPHGCGLRSRPKSSDTLAGGVKRSHRLPASPLRAARTQKGLTKEGEGVVHFFFFLVRTRLPQREKPSEPAGT